MAIFDKNRDRIRELEAKLRNGKGDPARIKSRIACLRKRGAELWISYRVNGRKQHEPVPVIYKGEAGAKTYEKERKQDLALGIEGNAEKRRRQAMRASVNEMSDFWLEYRKKKVERKNNPRAYRASKYFGGRVKRHCGEIRLIELDDDPQIIVDHIANLPEPHWAPKTVWNYATTLKSIINHWIRMKRLVIANPCNVLEIEPEIRKPEYTPTERDFESVIIASYKVGLPDTVRRLLKAVYESGLRIGEVIKWRVEDMDMAPPEFNDQGRPLKIPTFMTDILKQRRRTRVRLPMSRELWEVLREQVGDRIQGAVWPWSRPPYNLLKDSGLMEEAGVKYARPFHDYRRTRKTINKVEKGLPANMTMRLQGHSSQAMDEYYVGCAAEDLYPAVAESWRGSH